jgi:nucleoside-diphosphate-sugar epimerase
MFGRRHGARAMKALIVGGTGPTGPFIIRGLIERGYRVSMLHRSLHEIDEIPPEVEHIHVDPWEPGAVREALAGRTFDVSVVTYGRLRAIAELLVGKTGRLISAGGFPCYRGYFEPERFAPVGMPVPTYEDGPKVASEEEHRKGYRIRLTEETVLALHPEATHFRYPYVYGPRQLVPREWCIVRRVIDGRRHIILPEGGLTLCTFGYSGNVAHAVLLALDNPAVSAGQVYNAGDEQVLSLRQVVECICAALDHEMEIVSMPWEVARPAWPMIMHPLPTHRVLDIGKLRRELGYRDPVSPPAALALTARWYVANPPPPGGETEWILQDPFEYDSEDRLIALYKDGLERLSQVRFKQPPGLGLAYFDPKAQRDRQPIE